MLEFVALPPERICCSSVGFNSINGVTDGLVIACLGMGVPRERPMDLFKLLIVVSCDSFGLLHSNPGL